MDESEMDRARLIAAIEASLLDVQPRDEQAHGSQSPAVESSSHAVRSHAVRRHATLGASRSQVVDLTHDSDNDSEIQEVFPKSKSVVGSDTDNEADVTVNEDIQRAREIDNDLANEAAEGDDSFDEDMRRAIALSMQELNQDDEVTRSQAPAKLMAQKSTEKPTENPEQPLGVLGMNRKQMEQERLARQAKRKAGESVSVTMDIDNNQADKSASSLHGPPAKVRKTNPVRASESGDSSPFSRSSSRAVPSQDICDRLDANHDDCKVNPVARPLAQFPLGAVKKTSIGNAPRSNDDITIEEVLQRGDLELAVLSSFLWDMEWLFTKMDTVNTRFILVMHAKEEITVSRGPLQNLMWPQDSDIPPQFKRMQYQEETANLTNLRLCFPPMDGNINCMHSKLMLLFHPGYLRIAVPTANLTVTDWGENNLMENVSSSTRIMLHLLTWE
jgi:hypothetical protein